MRFPITGMACNSVQFFSPTPHSKNCSFAAGACFNRHLKYPATPPFVTQWYKRSALECHWLISQVSVFHPMNALRSNQPPQNNRSKVYRSRHTRSPESTTCLSLNHGRPARLAPNRYQWGHRPNLNFGRFKRAHCGCPAETRANECSAFMLVQNHSNQH